MRGGEGRGGAFEKIIVERCSMGEHGKLNAVCDATQAV